MKKILVINVNWLGDVLFSTPVLKALRNKNPQAHIACLVVARCEEILKNNPRINEVIVYDEYGYHRSILRKIELIRILRKKKFDEVYILHQSLKRAMIGYLAGIPERIGYNTKQRGFLLTQAVPVPGTQKHKIDYFLGILEATGVEVKDKNCEFFVSDQEKLAAQDILRFNGLERGEEFVIINSGGNWLLKRWPSEYFAKLADLLIDRFGVKVILVGAKKDKVLTQEIYVKMKKKPIILSGKISLNELGALMESSRCVVSADSGPMHIAAAVGANTVAIFGPTSSELTGPRGKGKVMILQENIGCDIPCYKLDCSNNRCMQAIGPEQVFKAVSKFLNKSNGMNSPGTRAAFS